MSTRRRFLRTLGLGVVVLLGAGPVLGRAVKRWRAPKRRRPDDLAPVPWIGHC